MPGEKVEDAAARRLKEEMGIKLKPEFSYKFVYKANLDQDLIEHELDYVFTGKFDGVPKINPSEVADWKFVDVGWLRDDIQKHPDKYTAWFKLIMERHS
jgi:isopentenyl-diphosphate Delta-isomerase